jgi:hypothetical protein
MDINNIIHLLIAVFFIWAAFKTLAKDERWKIIANKREYLIKEWLIIVGSIIMFICGFVLLVNSIIKLF